jgi:hypothetical protein
MIKRKFFYDKVLDFPISVQELVSKLIDNPGGFPVVFIDERGQVLNYKNIGIGKDAVMIVLSKVESFDNEK